MLALLTCRCNQIVNFFTQLVQNLFASSVIMSDRIVWICVLIQDMCTSWIFGIETLHYTLSLANVRVNVIKCSLGWCTNNFRAQAFQNIALKHMIEIKIKTKYCFAFFEKDKLPFLLTSSLASQ